MAATQLGISGMSEKELKELEDNVPPLSLKFMPFYIFDMSGANPKNYDLSVNTSHKSLEDIANVIIEYINKK